MEQKLKEFIFQMKIPYTYPYVESLLELQWEYISLERIPMKRFENNQMVSIEDPTDKSKTRIIITQTHPSDEKAVYYKTD